MNASIFEGGVVQPSGEGDIPVTWAVAFGVLCLLAMALRCYGIRFGLPAVYNQDEVAIMSRALAFAKGDPNPHNFLYPTLYFYVLAGWIGAYYAISHALGRLGTLREFQLLFFTDPTVIYLAGRVLTALCGTVSVVLVYRLGRAIWDWRAGLASALFLAVAPIAVADAHYVKHDVPVTLAALVLLAAAVRIWRSPADHVLPRARIAFAGMALGVAFAIHYYALFLAAPLVLTIAVHDHRRGFRQSAAHVLWALAVAAVTFFVCSPFVILDWPTAVRDIVANRQIVVDRAVAGGQAFASAKRYLTLLSTQATGWPVVALSLLGVTLLVHARRWALFALLGSFPLLFFAFISNTVVATRYLNPLIPFVALMAGYAVSRLACLPRGRHIAFGVAVAAALPGLFLSVRNDWFFTRADTRTLALAFVESHIPAGKTILVQPYSVPLAQSRDSVREALALHLGRAERAPVKFALRLSAPDGERPTYRTIYLGNGGLDLDKIYVGYEELGGPNGLAALRRLGVDYVVLKRYERDDAVTQTLLHSLSAEASRIAAFSPYREGSPRSVAPFLHNTDAVINSDLARPGPIVEVWKLAPDVPRG